MKEAIAKNPRNYDVWWESESNEMVVLVVLRDKWCKLHESIKDVHGCILCQAPECIFQKLRSTLVSSVTHFRSGESRFDYVRLEESVGDVTKIREACYLGGTDFTSGWQMTPSRMIFEHLVIAYSFWALRHCELFLRTRNELVKFESSAAMRIFISKAAQTYERAVGNKPPVGDLSKPTVRG